jgi:RHS repeat-associated protein
MEGEGALATDPERANERPFKPAAFEAKTPSLSLPKAGGAIRSIGEKFSANPVTGAGSAAIPIPASPGRGGLNPQLSLAYSSGTGNGAFGLGWRLSVASIVRRTDKGLPCYADDEERDVFLLYGVEDLVPYMVDNGSGAWVRDDSCGPRTVGGRTYAVRRYRPRIEGGFARIERWIAQGDPSDHFWRSISSDNVTTWYGRTPESRISDPNDPTRIFSWLACETYDDKGNVLVFRYKVEDSSGLNRSQRNEFNRTDISRTSNRYLKKVRYGNVTPFYSVLVADQPWPVPAGAEDADASANWHFEVVFDYGEHHPTNPLPSVEVAPWPVRHDPFSSYRACFEVRSYRRCQRILMFHHFPDRTEIGANCLVRASNLFFSDPPADPLDPIYSFLIGVQQIGYQRSAGGGYSSKPMPRADFDYTVPSVDERVFEADSASLESMPAGLADPSFRWVDLDGEGSNGLLAEQGGYWHYAANWSPANLQPDGSGQATLARFAPMEAVSSLPPFPAAGLERRELVSLSGNGRLDLVAYGGSAPGFFERTEDRGWENFEAFESLPVLDWNDPNLRFVDLTGDGLPDILISQGGELWWYESLAQEGFRSGRLSRLALNEEAGPRFLFSDSTESIFLADMSGDGLSDIVRIRNGEVCYWPNLGYGRFGAKVGMDAAPWFDSQDGFDGRRIRLADIDGGGTADIVYLHGDGPRLYFNLSGNGWSPPYIMRTFAPVHNAADIEVLDFLGKGTACLVWSSRLPGDARRSVRYTRLMGEDKPHLLVGMRNNLGAETRIHYAPSTKFYVQDQLMGTPWTTRLPFPVHVVERVETIDHISQTRFVSRYAYHHGYYDGDEREFRGFGMVEEWDTEAYEDYVEGVTSNGSAQDSAAELFQPPVTTRTWYHTGAYADGARMLHQNRREYFAGVDGLPEPRLPAGLGGDDLRECVRALKGVPLRQEIYSFDASSAEAFPYSVAENSFEVRCLQPRTAGHYGVFHVIGRESLSAHLERNPADPRITHSLQLETDEFGNATKVASVAYGRTGADPSLPAPVTAAQQQSYITYSEADYTPDFQASAPTDIHRLRVAYENRGYEITGLNPTSHRFSFEELASGIESASDIDYEIVADGTSKQKRLLFQSRSVFLDNSLNPLPLGQWDTLGIGYQGYQLAFTPGVVASQYAGKVSDVDFVDAGYVHFAGDLNWWIPSATVVFPSSPASHFYLPSGARDPLGVQTLATRDVYDLLTEEVEVGASWNVLTAANDYRVLAPVLIADPNGNGRAVQYDELGLVVATAVMGKDGSGDGDTLADPTTRLEYDLFNWVDNKQPVFVHSFARERHGAANPRWQESYTYSNGHGGVALVKAQAHPGKALQPNPDGTATEVDANPRWIGNGRTIVNNKGKPVKRYDPYFSVTSDYEDEKAVRQVGVTPILFYDPIGRNVRTDLPNGTFSTAQFNPWMQRTFDPNDNVKASRWYSDRGSPDPTTQTEPVGDPERRAAWLAAKHDNTPKVVHVDSLGRPTYTVSDYGSGKTAAVRRESDLTGRFSTMFDQEQREVARGFVGLTGTPIFGDSAERGQGWTFQNVLGAVVKTWDEHGRQLRAEYDALHRPVSSFVQQAGQAEILFTYVVYGDRLGQTSAQSLNLLGTAYLIFDQAGMLRVEGLDFKGNPKSVARVMAAGYKGNLDWSALAKQPDVASIQAVAAPALESAEVFSASSLYDALNRPIQVTLPDGTVIVPTYDEANFPVSLGAQIRGQGNFIDFLQQQDYDAKGQRQLALYGNKVSTRYFYDPQTFRLTNLLTGTSGAAPQTQALQNVNYWYDPVGNITQVRDDAQETYYFNNAVVKAESLYEYDATYQLIRATGRELAGGVNDAVRTDADLDFVQLPYANDAEAVRNYAEEYEYDLLGNIKTLRHRFKSQAGIGNGWTRHYRYAFEDTPGDRTNRLTSNSMPGDSDAGPYTATYGYDAYGNMSRMPNLAAMSWNFMDQLQQVDLGGGGTAYCVYGLGGQRLRKVIERNANLREEWIYLGAVTIFRRRRNTNDLRLERWTVHISDNTGHIAQVDTKTLDHDNADPANPLNVALIRYQYANYLGSAVLEADESGNAISYEEYHPYGTTAYRSAKAGFDLSLKRYRFSGKERDDETGLYYFGARYYAPWLGRWASSDAAGFVGGVNLYRYCSGNPIMFGDPSGRDDKRLNPAGEVTTWTKGTEWVYRQNGKELSDAEIRANFARYAEASGRRYTPETLTYEWVDKGGKRVPVFNAEWLDKNGEPLLPQKGEFGYVAPMNKQEKAQYAVPGDMKSRLDENEHTSTHAANAAVDPNYTDNEYKKDATVKSPRGVSLDKTRADNADSAQIKQKIANGQSVDITEEVDMKGNQNFQDANNAAKAAGQPNIRNPGSINRGTLEQINNRFERGRGQLPPGVGERIAAFGQGLGTKLVGLGKAAGVTFARALIPGFVEAEASAVAAPYATGLLASAASSVGVSLPASTFATADAIAAAPTTFAAAVTLPAIGGAVVGNIVEKEYGVGAAVASAAITGAIIGSFIPIPGLSTLAGAAVGAAIGLIGYGISKLF